MAHWLGMRHGISQWKARRWIAAAHALETLPDLSHAFSSGELGIDKVVELARFATFESEAGLIAWARFVSCWAVRHRGDLTVRRSLEDAQQTERSRFLSWWYLDDGTRFGLEGELPAAQGAVVARALERLAESVPVMPGEDHGAFAEASGPTRSCPCVRPASHTTPIPIGRPSWSMRDSPTSSPTTERPSSRAGPRSMRRPPDGLPATLECRS
jgi:hypothetical protein